MFHSWFLRGATAALVLLTVTLPALAAEAVDLFAGMQSGELEVRLLVKDARQATVVMTNKTNRVLTVKMPDAFAGVLAQPGNNFFNAGLGGQNNQNGLGGNQSIGGGFPGQQNNGNNFNNAGGPFFHIAPEKSKKVKATVMCLEHGKPNPNLNVQYEIVPIAQYTSSVEVQEVCCMVGRGETDQVSAQAAAWHLANEMTWDQLRQKVGIKHWNGRTEPFFTERQLEKAQEIVSVAKRRAEANSKSPAPNTKQEPKTPMTSTETKSARLGN